jgi:hypothetical protein
MTLLPASAEILSKFPAARDLSSSGVSPLDLSGVGDPAGSNATAGLALRFTGTHKPLHHDKEIPWGGGGGILYIRHLITNIFFLKWCAGLNKLLNAVYFDNENLAHNILTPH